MKKTSNKILVVTALLIIGYLITYNFALKAEYLKGDYKKRFYHMQRINIGGFNAIEHNIGNYTNVEIEQGPEYGAWVNDRLKDDIAITRHGTTLRINYIGKEEGPHRYFAGSSVTITCPVINSVTSRPLKTEDQWANATIRISGFKQDAPLIIRSGKSADIQLNRDSLNKLTAITTESKSTITIHGDNTIKDGNFQILGRSELKLLNPVIDKSTFSYTDSSTMTLSGRALQQLRQ